MKNLLSNKYLLLLLRILLAFVFIYAGIEKIADPSGFSDSLDNYRILPLFSVNIFAIILPWIELIAGLFLLFGIKVKENSLIISFCLCVFIIAITISLFRGLNIDCGCFGTVNGSKVGVYKLIEDFVLLLMGVLLINFDSKFLSLKNQTEN